MSPLPAFAAGLPSPAQLRERLRALTVLEACLGSEWPRYTFTPADDGGFERFRFENGGGDNYYVFFGRSLTFLRAFDHESLMSPYGQDGLWPGLLDGLPEALEPLTRLADEDEGEDYPALTMALWHDGSVWRHGDLRPWRGEEPELTDWMLEPLLDFTPAEAAEEFGEYYSRPVDAEAVEALLRGAPVDRALVERIASDADGEYVAGVVRALDS